MCDAGWHMTAGSARPGGERKVSVCVLLGKAKTRILERKWRAKRSRRRSQRSVVFERGYRKGAAQHRNGVPHSRVRGPLP